MASMTMLDAQPEETATQREVAFYLSDLTAQLAAMARGAGLDEVAQTLTRAHEQCVAAGGD